MLYGDRLTTAKLRYDETYSANIAKTDYYRPTKLASS